MKLVQVLQTSPKIILLQIFLLRHNRRGLKPAAALLQRQQLAYRTLTKLRQIVDQQKEAVMQTIYPGIVNWTGVVGRLVFLNLTSGVYIVHSIIPPHLFWDKFFEFITQKDSKPFPPFLM